MARKPKLRDLGYVLADDRTRYTLREDGTWTVVREGTNLPMTARAIHRIYQGYVEPPEAPGIRKLRDLATQVGGEVVWHDLQHSSPDARI